MRPLRHGLPVQRVDGKINAWPGRIADLRKHEMAERADLFFQPNPGTDLVWLSAIARYIPDNGLEKKEFLAQWVNGLEEYKKASSRLRWILPRKPAA
jgi:predicted molibdopterin-dependent oxidoreductase YjgC